MGMTTNIILFTFLFSMTVYFFTGSGSIMWDMFSCMGGTFISFSPASGHTSACTSIKLPVNIPSLDIPVLGKVFSGTDNIELSMFAVLIFCFGLMALGFALSIAGTRFPDPYTWFSIAGVFLLGFVTFPVSLLQSLVGDPNNPATVQYIPPALALMIVGGFIILYALAFFGFYKNGGGSP